MGKPKKQVMYRSISKRPWFTPLLDGKRQKFSASRIRVIEDNGLGSKALGYRGILLIKDVAYRVIGTSCGLPNCNCDAKIVPTRATPSQGMREL